MKKIIICALFLSLSNIAFAENNVLVKVVNNLQKTPVDIDINYTRSHLDPGPHNWLPDRLFKTLQPGESVLIIRSNEHQEGAIIFYPHFLVLKDTAGAGERNINITEKLNSIIKNANLDNTVMLLSVTSRGQDIFVDYIRKERA